MKAHHARRIILYGIILISLIVISLNYSEISTWFESTLEENIKNFGYSSIFIAAFLLESFPQPFISSLIPFATGLFFNLSFIPLISMVVIGSIIGNYVAFTIGAHYGKPVANLVISQKSYRRSVSWFKRHGRKSMVILALTPLPYFPMMAGILRMSIREFTLYGVIPRIIHLISFGYMLLYII